MISRAPTVDGFGVGGVAEEGGLVVGDGGFQVVGQEDAGDEENGH